MNHLTTLQLEREPFSTSPDPSFFYRSKSHKTALNCLEIAIRLKRGLSIILADVGMGKTTLSRTLAQCFSSEEDQYVIHLILDPSFKSEYQFLSHLTRTFGVSPFFRSTVDHKEAIEKYLFRRSVDEGKTVVLMIDEGQKLTKEQLEILRTLLNYETNEKKMLQLVIFGQMEMLETVNSVRNFMDRVCLRYIINPLDEFETGELISFRLRKAGDNGEKNLFNLEAVKRIHEYTKGYPRKIGLICHKAIEVLLAEESEVVTKEMIDKIILREISWT